MSVKLIEESTLTSIADAIRTKAGTQNQMTPLQMPQAIDGIDWIDAYFISKTMTTYEHLTVETVPNNLFYGCTQLTHVNLPAVKYLNGGVFNGCTGIVEHKFSKVVGIGGNVFQNNTSCLKYDFSDCASVPNLSNANAFQNINQNAKIIVPDDLYSQWIAANNWSSLASYIIKKSDYDAL